jgi:hypothetical protein
MAPAATRLTDPETPQRPAAGSPAARTTRLTRRMSEQQRTTRPAVAGAEAGHPQSPRYDADVALTAFAAGLKDAVDLDSIRDDLATVSARPWRPPMPGADQLAAEARLCHFVAIVGPVCGHAATDGAVHARAPMVCGLWLRGGRCAGRGRWADGGP